MLKGTLDDFTLPDIFRLMSLAKRTGKVDVIRSAGEGKVFFRDGEVYYAESTVSREPLGQKLIRSGALTEGALMKALDENATSGSRVGEILVRNGSVSAEQLQRAVQQQIEDSVFDLLRWGAGEFSWDAGVVADVEVPISVSVENLIIEASRRLDELEVITRKIPSEATVLRMAATPPEGAVEINITPEEWRMLVLVNGARSIHDIATTTGTDDLTAMRSLYGLVSAGLVEVEDPGEEADESEAERDEIVGFGDVSSNQAAAAEVTPAELDVVSLPEAFQALSPLDDPQDSAQIDAPELLDPPLSQMEPQPVDEEVFTPVAVEEPSPFAQELQVEGDMIPFPDQALEEFSAGEFEPLAPEPEVSLDAAALNEADEVFFSSLEDVSEEMPVASYDAPAPDELVTQTPDADDFLNDLLGGDAGNSFGSFGSFEDPIATETPSFPPPAPEVPAPAIPEPVQESHPISTPTPAPAPARSTQEDSSEGQVDRASVVRELAGLFSDDVPRVRAVPAAKADPDAPEAETDGRKRVEDDDQVNRGLISRLIDGVKGL